MSCAFCPPDGPGEVKKFKPGDSPSFFYNPTWSPDGKKIAYSDKRLNIWYHRPRLRQVDEGGQLPYDDGPPSAASWSPDGKWLAYSRQLKSYLNAVFLYSRESRKSHQITDGMSDARSPAFDKGGKYLFFTASTDIGPCGRQRHVDLEPPGDAVRLRHSAEQGRPSPLAPESDDEKDKKDGDKEQGEGQIDKKEADKKPPKVKMDLADIDQRTLALPSPAKDYVDLLVGKAGMLFLVEGPASMPEDTPPAGGPPSTVHRFDLSKRKVEKLIDGVTHVAVSNNGEKLLYHQGGGWFLVPSGQPPKPGDGALKLDGFEVRVDPPAEWRQIYREVYRLERDFLYDPHFHGYDLATAWAEHEQYLPGLGSRHDLNYLLDELLSGLSLQHVYLMGGDVPRAENRKCGLLGADYRVENKRHRIAKIYRGENWNPSLRAPLTQPGAGVKEGEYLLAVNGQELKGEDEVYRLFEGTAGRQTVIKVGPNPDGENSREVTVVPVSNERALRNLAWVDANRRAVDKATGGRVAYVYLPDTSVEGYARFNRYFFAQAGRDAVIVDERYNGGGLLADHVIDYLRQPIRNYASTREGADQAFPTSAIPGPKVMLINERAGSGGDYLPYTFRQSKLGLLVGKRTWGGLVGIGGYPQLIDGGGVTAPRWGIWFPNGRWDVENRGVPPDVEVEFDPKAIRAGHDPQLEKGIEIVMAELKKHPVHQPARPPFPNYYRPGATEPAEGK